MRSAKLLVGAVVVIAVAWAAVFLHAARDLPEITIRVPLAGNAPLEEREAVRLGGVALAQITHRDVSEFRPVPLGEEHKSLFTRRPNSTSSGYVLWSDEKSGEARTWHYMTTLERMPELVQITVLEGE